MIRHIGWSHNTFFFLRYPTPTSCSNLTSSFLGWLHNCYPRICVVIFLCWIHYFLIPCLPISWFTFLLCWSIYSSCIIRKKTGWNKFCELTHAWKIACSWLDGYSILTKIYFHFNFWRFCSIYFSNSIVASANSDAIPIFFFLSMWLLTFLKLLGSSLSPGVLNFHINVPYWSFSHGLGTEWDISVEELTHFNFEKFFYMVYLITSYMCLRNSY